MIQQIRCVVSLLWAVDCGDMCVNEYLCFVFKLSFVRPFLILIWFVCVMWVIKWATSANMLLFFSQKKMKSKMWREKKKQVEKRENKRQIRVSKCDRIYCERLTAMDFLLVEISYEDGLWVILKWAKQFKRCEIAFSPISHWNADDYMMFALHTIIVNRSIDLTKKREREKEE